MQHPTSHAVNQVFPAHEAAPISPELAASVLPEELLHNDEVVMMLTKPSLWFLLLTSFRFILIVVLLCILAVKLFQMNESSALTPSAAGILAVLLALGRLIWALLVWTSHIYMLTNKRIVTIKGVINVRMVQAPLRKVQRTALYRPWLFRIFGIGTVGIATAATETFDATWLMIGRPLQTHEQIVAAINKVQ